MNTCKNIYLTHLEASKGVYKYNIFIYVLRGIFLTTQKSIYCWMCNEESKFVDIYSKDRVLLRVVETAKLGGDQIWTLQ
jgi:hypothetical protein